MEPLRLNKLGVGIVGANWAARGHLPGWRTLPRHVEPLGIATRSRETAAAAAAKLGLPRAYDSFADMLADPSIDIVSLGGPPPARYEMTMAALDAGKHVFSCIPFAMSAGHAREMARRSQDTGRVGAVDAYFMWTPGYSFAKDLIDDGFLGHLYAVTVDFSMSQFVRPTADYPYRWTGLAENGTGVLPNSCSHVFHTLIALFGGIAEVIAQTRIAKPVWEFEDGTCQVAEVADTATLLCRLAGGALVTIHAGRAVPAGTGLSITAYGSAGRLTLRSPAYPLDRNVSLTAARPARMFEGAEEPLSIPARYFEVPGGEASGAGEATTALSLGRLFSNMVAGIRDGGVVTPDFRRAAHVQDIVAAAFRSEETRRWESVELEE